MLGSDSSASSIMTSSRGGEAAFSSQSSSTTNNNDVATFPSSSLTTPPHQDAIPRQRHPTLQLIILECLSSSKKLRMSPYNALAILDSLRDFEFTGREETEAASEARRRCVASIRMMYDTIKEDVTDLETLRLLLGVEAVEQLEKDSEERRRMRRLTHTFGVVVEKRTVQEAKRGEDGSYPIEALLINVAWPPEVPPHQREQYLSPSVFLATFKMTKEEFNSLPRYVRDRMKKDVGLF